MALVMSLVVSLVIPLVNPLVNSLVTPLGISLGIPLGIPLDMPLVSLILKLNLVLNSLILNSWSLNLATQCHAPVTLTGLNLSTSYWTLVSLRVIASLRWRRLLLTSEILRLLPRLHINVLNSLATVVLLISLAVFRVRL